MAIVLMTDLTKCSFGTSPVLVGRGDSGSFSVQETVVDSRDQAAGMRYSDTVMTTIKGDLQARDPLAVPLLAALTGVAQSLIIGGRIANTTTYQDATLSNAVMTALGMDLKDQGEGSCNASFQNRAADTTAAVVSELAYASGSAQAMAARAGIVRILSGAEFTDDASDSVTLDAISAFSWKAAPDYVIARSSNPAASSLTCLADILDVSPYWNISGTISMYDATLDTGAPVAQVLAALKRGTLVLPVSVAGQNQETPVDKTITISRIKFRNPRQSLRARGESTFDLDFQGNMVSAAGAIQTLAQVLTVA